MKYALNVMLAIVSLFAVACSSGQSQEGGSITDLKPTEFKAKMDNPDAIIIDVRTPEEVANGIIPGAKHINIHDADFETRINELAKDKPVLVYCKAGGRSSRAAKKMNGLGFAEVYNLVGGITSWKSEGLEIKQ